MNEFEGGFIAAFIGYWIGHMIDQTRFGQWFNANPIVNFIWNIGKALLFLVSAVAILYFVYCVMCQF